LKVSDILLNYLLKHKKLPLPALGTFNLTGSYAMSADDKSIVLPAGSVEFILDPATPEDPELIAAIAAETGKFKPLASADLESLILQGKQLMNISKPFMIEGIGTLQKNHRNEVEYIPFIDETQRQESDLRLEEPGEAIRFDNNYLRPPSSKNSQSRNITFALLMLAGIAILGLVGYYLYQQSKEISPTLNEGLVMPDTAQNIPVPVQIRDTATAAAPVSDTSKPISSILPKDSSVFFVVVEYAKKDRAFKRYADLREWGHKVVMVTKDSVDFKISFPIKAPLTDTARHRDSLTRFFGKKAWIEIQ
jgi:hypothetical protein